MAYQPYGQCKEDELSGDSFSYSLRLAIDVHTQTPENDLHMISLGSQDPRGWLRLEPRSVMYTTLGTVCVIPNIFESS